GRNRRHLEGGLLPCDASAAASGRSASGGRRARRAVQRRPLHGDAEPVQLAVLQGLHSLRDQDASAATAAVSPHPTYPRCIAAASSGSVAIVSTATISGRLALRASDAF